MPWLDPQPALPWEPESEAETSRAAAVAALEQASSVRAEVYRYIRGRGRLTGATDDEIEQALGLRHQTASARRRELVLSDLVEDSGRRRPTRSGRAAVVWIVK